MEGGYSSKRADRSTSEEDEDGHTTEDDDSLNDYIQRLENLQVRLGRGNVKIIVYSKANHIHCFPHVIKCVTK